MCGPRLPPFQRERSLQFSDSVWRFLWQVGGGFASLALNGLCCCFWRRDAFIFIYEKGYILLAYLQKRRKKMIVESSAALARLLESRNIRCWPTTYQPKSCGAKTRWWSARVNVILFSLLLLLFKYSFTPLATFSLSLSVSPTLGRRYYLVDGVHSS